MNLLYYIYIYFINNNKENIEDRRKYKQKGRKRPLDTPKRMIERREREGEREKER